MEMPSMGSCFLWPVIFQVIQLSLSSSLPIGNETDRLSLLAFKDQIEADPLGTLSSWNESSHFCEWSGACYVWTPASESVIELSINKFTVKVPDLGHMPKLRRLVFQTNDLGNNEDDDLGFLYPLANSTNLEVMGINDNNFGGALPEKISNFSIKLMHMTFRGNQIRGIIPTDTGNLVNLQTLALEMNQFTGTIPAGSIGKLPILRVLPLHSNKISGSIPSSLGNSTSSINLYLYANNLHGSIPSSLENCQNLLSLLLSRNNLSGPIPKEPMRISSLSRYLDLSENQLTGSLPMEVGKLVNLGYLTVSYNRLSGEIPRTLGSRVSLEYLYLADNSFHGSIPESLGEVPVQGVFANASGFSVLENEELCGGIPQLNLSRCTSKKSEKLKSSTKLKLIIAIPCGFVGINILLLSSVLFFFLREKKSRPASGSPWESTFQRVAYEELLQATNGFSAANLIGSGSFGSVYKGILKTDGAAVASTVAVKVFNLLREGASKSFMAECAALVNIRHRNLVKVLTACSGIDFQGNDFKALVYEFMVNGSIVYYRLFFKIYIFLTLKRQQLYRERGNSEVATWNK
uniref:Protein kinase domain-containing protein n=1 Tax=Populus alba TaxID=43335 RepID=A0A4U5Q7T1_POPAL|nr:hypothetical protein D5086_0000139730 [Populus alba]